MCAGEGEWGGRRSYTAVYIIGVTSHQTLRAKTVIILTVMTRYVKTFTLTIIPIAKALSLFYAYGTNMPASNLQFTISETTSTKYTIISYFIIVNRYRDEHVER